MKINVSTFERLAEFLSDHIDTCYQCPIVDFCHSIDGINCCEDAWEKWLKGKTKIPTNFERIKEMTVDEMAHVWSLKSSCLACPIREVKRCDSFVSNTVCEKFLKEWLESKTEYK